MSKPAKSDVLVFGNALTAPLLVEYFREAGQSARPFVVSTAISSKTRRSAIHIGNGEYFANARKVFGTTVAEVLWEISTANMRRARTLGEKWGVQPAPRRLAWYATSEREANLQRETVELMPELILRVPTEKAFLSVLEEPTLICSAPSTVVKDHVEALLALEKNGLDTIAHFRRDGREESVKAAVVVLASEEIQPGLTPFLADKWIPVTLSSFVFPARQPLPHAFALCNAGADFAVTDGLGWRLGSYRNLYQDKAVGRQTTADPITLSGVRKFFGDLGWIDPTLEPGTDLAYENLPCDGLPIAGALPEHPGVYVLGGFGARGLNFTFEMGHRLVQDIVHGGNFQPLKTFSTKRFL